MPIDIIAEVGSVHDGSFGNACKLIELAKDVGASTVKFQMHLPQYETTITAPSPSYFQAESRYAYFERTGFSHPQWRQLIELACEIGIDFCCSPFSAEALERLIDLGVKKIKIPSGEVTNLPLLRAASERSQMVIVSSGMSEWSELDQAMEVISQGHAELAIMQCTSEYPCQPQNVGLNIIPEMAKRYNCPVGFSDHTMGVAAPIGAIYNGATIIEKHLTFSRSMYGSDARHSMEPSEFRFMVSALNEAHEIREHPVRKDTAERFREMKQIFEKSLVASANLRAGTIIQESHIAYKKPGTGMKPNELHLLIGRELRHDVLADHIFSPDDLV